MKKLMALILSVILCLMPVTAAAQAEIPEDMYIMMGDLNKDGKVTAMDARTALRYAARIEQSADITLLQIDADGNGKVSASDAREILRVAAKISKFVTGFDGNGTPCVINTLRSNVYYIEVVYNESASSQNSFTLAKNNENTVIRTTDESIVGNMEMGNLKFTECGIMSCGEDMYIIFSTKDTSIAMYCSKETMEKADISPDEFNEMIAMIEEFLPQELGIPEKVEKDGKEMYCYTYKDGEQTCQMYIGTNGILSHIDCESKGEMVPMLVFNKISGDKTDKYFSLDNFDEIW